MSTYKFEQNRAENDMLGHRGHLCDRFSFRGARGSKIARKTILKVTEDTSVIYSRFVAHKVPKSRRKRHVRSQRTPL
eukprot:2843341-Rhodomonas_salina.1